MNIKSGILTDLIENRRQSSAPQYYMQDNLFYVFLGLSALLHGVMFFVDGFAWLNEKPPIMEEWAVDAEIITDIDWTVPDASVLPKAEVAEKAAVPDNMLPQLPKKFQIKEEIKPDIKPIDTKTPDKKVEDLAKEKAQVKKDLDIKVKKNPDEANKIAKLEALERLKKEQLRLDQKKSDKEKTEIKDDLARIAQDISRRMNKSAGSFGSPVAKARARKYQGIIQMAVRRNYALPEAYNLKNADMKAIIEIIVNEGGNLMKLKMYKSSGDQVFDELALKAVKASVPLPKPPKELVAQTILLNFTPSGI